MKGAKKDFELVSSSTDVASKHRQTPNRVIISVYTDSFKQIQKSLGEIMCVHAGVLIRRAHEAEPHFLFWNQWKKSFVLQNKISKGKNKRLLQFEYIGPFSEDDSIHVLVIPHEAAIAYRRELCKWATDSDANEFVLFKTDNNGRLIKQFIDG